MWTDFLTQSFPYSFFLFVFCGRVLASQQDEGGEVEEIEMEVEEAVVEEHHPEREVVSFRRRKKFVRRFVVGLLVSACQVLPSVLEMPAHLFDIGLFLKVRNPFSTFKLSFKV